MDRFVPRRRRTSLLLAMLAFTLGLVPTTGGRAALPHISDEQAGDPGDGVLRPADVTVYAPTTSAQTTSAVTTGPTSPTRLSSSWLLVPVVAPTGSPWTLTFRLIRVEPADAGRARPGSASSFGGRWHRAP